MTGRSLELSLSASPGNGTVTADYSGAGGREGGRRVTGEAIYYPSRNRPRWRCKHLFLTRKGTPEFLQRRGLSTNRR